MRSLRIPLRVVFYQDNSDWIAHCLEFDLCGDGTTKEAALESLSEAIQIQVEASNRHQNLKNLFSPADGELFEKFAAGRELLGIGELHITVEPTPVIIERTESRQYSDDPSENDLVSA